MDHELSEREKSVLARLKERFNENSGELANYLEGLLYYNGVSYWDYIHQDTLLSLQQPKTQFDDELIFITYHQISELYFKLIRHELDIITCHQRKEYLVKNNWIKRLGRVVNYFDKLTQSFDIMTPGQFGQPNQFFDRDEFAKFRLTLMPASGFQTAQFRMIEIMSTGVFNLLKRETKQQLLGVTDLKKLYRNIYWKSGGRFLPQDAQSMDEVAYQKIKTLLNFERRYDQQLLEMVEAYMLRNIEYIFFHYEGQNQAEHRQLRGLREDPELRALLLDYDKAVNLRWKGVHYGSVRQHMSESTKGTGGTNWQEFLPPAKQLLQYFPKLHPEPTPEAPKP